MTIEQAYPIVTEVMKISDTAEGNGVYELEVRVLYGPDEEPEQTIFVSRPDDPYGINPQIRQWMSENPDAPVHAYVPKASNLNEQITNAPSDLTGGPSLSDIFGGANQLFPTS